MRREVESRDSHVIEIKRWVNGTCNIVGTIERVPVQHKEWRSVRYKGRRYQLFGGIRTLEFIDVEFPLKQRPVGDYSIRRLGDNYGLYFRGSLVECGVFATRETAEKYKRIAEAERARRVAEYGAATVN